MEIKTPSGLIAVSRGWDGWEGKSDRTKIGNFDPSHRSLVLEGSRAESRFGDFQTFLSTVTEIPWVYACVSVIAYNFATIPWRLMDGDKPIEDPANPFLQLWDVPNPHMTGFHFRELMSFYLELTGEVFISMEERDAAGHPREMYLPNPARMRVIPDPQDFIKGYVYDASGQGFNPVNQWLVPYEVDEIVHIRLANPLNEYRGLGNVEAARRLLSIISNMIQNEDSYWASGGRITGVLETDQSVDDLAFERLIERWRYFTSDKKQRYKTAILEQGLKYSAVAEGLKGIDLTAISKDKRDQLLAVFGVPPNKLGLIENASYKADEADRFFWSETMEPKLTRFEDGIQKLVDVFDVDWRWEFERKNYEDDQTKLANALVMRNLKCFTNDEIRAYIGMPEVGGDEGKVVVLNVGDVVVQMDEVLEAGDLHSAGSGGGNSPGGGGGAPKGGGTPPGPAGPSGPRGNGSTPNQPGGGRGALPSGVGPKVVSMMPQAGGKEAAEAAVKALREDLDAKMASSTVLTAAERGYLVADFERRVSAARSVARGLRAKGVKARAVGTATGIAGGIARLALARQAQMEVEQAAEEFGVKAARSGSVEAPAITEAARRATDQSRSRLVAKYLPELRKAFRAQRAALSPLISHARKISDDAERREYLKANWPGGPDVVLAALHAEAANSGWERGKRLLGFDVGKSAVFGTKDADDAAGYWDEAGNWVPGAITDASGTDVPLPDLQEVAPVRFLNPYLDRQWQALAAREENRVQGVDETTLDAVADTVEEGVRRGYSAVQIATGYADEGYDGVAGVFDEAADWRAETIARTETQFAYNFGAVTAYADSGVAQVEAMDGGGDPECAARDGQTFDIDPDMGGPVDDSGDVVVDHPNGTLAWAPVLDDSIDLVDSGAVSIDEMGAFAWSVKVGTGQTNNPQGANQYGTPGSSGGRPADTFTTQSGNALDRTGAVLAAHSAGTGTHCHGKAGGGVNCHNHGLSKGNHAHAGQGPASNWGSAVGGPQNAVDAAPQPKPASTSGGSRGRGVGAASNWGSALKKSVHQGEFRYGTGDGFDVHMAEWPPVEAKAFGLGWHLHQEHGAAADAVAGQEDARSLVKMHADLHGHPAPCEVAGCGEVRAEEVKSRKKREEPPPDPNLTGEWLNDGRRQSYMRAVQSAHDAMAGTTAMTTDTGLNLHSLRERMREAHAAAGRAAEVSGNELADRGYSQADMDKMHAAHRDAQHPVEGVERFLHHLDHVQEHLPVLFHQRLDATTDREVMEAHAISRELQQRLTRGHELSKLEQMQVADPVVTGAVGGSLRGTGGGAPAAKPKAKPKAKKGEDDAEAKAPLEPQATVGYREGVDGASCADCQFFKGAGRPCAKVQGPVEPDMTCDLFEAADQDEKVEPSPSATLTKELGDLAEGIARGVAQALAEARSAGHAPGEAEAPAPQSYDGLEAMLHDAVGEKGDKSGPAFRQNQFTAPIKRHLDAMDPLSRIKYERRYTPRNREEARALRSLVARPSEGPQEVDDQHVTDSIRPSLAGLREDMQPPLAAAVALRGGIGEEREVPVARLVATKPHLDRNAVAATIKSLAGDPDFQRPGYLPVVAMHGGEHYVVDGHHRTEGAAILGRPTMRARVFDLGAEEVKAYDPDQPRDDGGRWSTTGGGGAATEAPVRVHSIEEAIALLGKGKGVMFDRPTQAVTLLHRLKEMADEAKALGQKAPVYDLCKVSVEGTNLFCAQNVGIPRDQMPQLKGVPVPGSPADLLQKDAKGEVNLGPAFRDFLQGQGHQIEDTTEKASLLRASQREMDGSKVGGMMVAMEQGKIAPDPIFVSKENYIVDGHHRWAANVGLSLGRNEDVEMPVARIDMPILETLKQANEFAIAMGIPQVGVGEPKKKALSRADNRRARIAVAKHQRGA